MLSGFRLINEIAGPRRRAASGIGRPAEQTCGRSDYVARIAADCLPGVLAMLETKRTPFHLLEKSIKEGLSSAFRIDEKELTVSMTVASQYFRQTAATQIRCSECRGCIEEGEGIG